MRFFVPNDTALSPNAEKLLVMMANNLQRHNISLGEISEVLQISLEEARAVASELTAKDYLQMILDRFYVNTSKVLQMKPIYIKPR